MNKASKIILWLAGILVILTLVVVLGISPLTKYLVNKNGKEWTGRTLHVEKVSINLFRGSILLKDFKMYEPGDKILFFGADSLYANLSLLKAFRSIYEITQLTMVGPEVNIMQGGNHFNFDDLMKRFMESDSIPQPDTTPSEPVQYFIRNLSLKNGRIHYTDQQLSSKISLKEISLNCPLIAWDTNALDLHYSFAFVSQGLVRGDFSLNMDELKYSLKMQALNIDLAFLYPYLRSSMKINTFASTLSSDLAIRGDFDEPTALRMKGSLQMDKFKLTDKQNVTVTALESFLLRIDSIDTKSNYYDFREIELLQPYLCFALDKKGDNLSRVFMLTADSLEVNAQSVEASAGNPFILAITYLQQAFTDYVSSSYRIDTLRIIDGTILYEDYTLEDPFQYEFEKFDLTSTQINSKSERVEAKISSILNKTGKLTARLVINPQDYSDMSLFCKIEGPAISTFSPYSRHYVAHAFTRGNVTFISDNTLVDNVLKSENRFFVKKIEVSKKINNPDAYNVPLRLAIALLRDLDGNIDLEIPVEGNLNDPEYKLGKAIWKIVENILLKTVTAPFRLLANAFGGSEDDIKALEMDFLQDTLGPSQIKTLDLLAKIMTDKPELILEYTPYVSVKYEKLLLAQNEAWRRYQNAFNQPMALAPVNLKDVSFNDFLNRQLGAEAADMPVPEKCRLLAGESWLEEKHNTIRERRTKSITDYLTLVKGLKPERFKLKPATDVGFDTESRPRLEFGIGVEE